LGDTVSPRRKFEALRDQVLRTGVPLKLTVVSAIGVSANMAMCKFWVRGKNPDAKYQTDVLQSHGTELVFNFRQLVPGAEEGDVLEIEIWDLGLACSPKMLTKGVLPVTQDHLSQKRARVSVPMADPETRQLMASLELELETLNNADRVASVTFKPKTTPRPRPQDIVDDDEPTLQPLIVGRRAAANSCRAPTSASDTAAPTPIQSL